ncbi:LysR family transcriptional regulator [Frateuria defendens]|uniref:LysR family transcriptional regulator n=1 Tax=Frateuria defendens TaxID=2219559 RepID=UPI00066FE815|nr:LysR family transcriptional regulator [Frateuria defendens]
MQLRHLKTFVAVAATLNVTRAAERIHLAQSSVTEQIQALEAELGAALFDRSPRGLRLTEAGRRLLGYAGSMLSLAEEARAAVADTAARTAGELEIGGLETLCAAWLPPLLAAFRRRHPAVALHVRSAGSGALRAAVGRSELDVCFVFGEDGFGPGVQSEPLARERLAVIVPPGHRLAGRRAVSAADLAGEPFLATEPGCVYRRMFEDAFPAGDPHRPPLAAELGSLTAACALVEAGLGCALVPRLAVDGARRLAVLAWPDAPEVAIAMAWRRRRVQAPALRRFIEAAREHVRLPEACA